MIAVDDEMRETITLHGLGFIQVKLRGSNNRLHVWHPDLPRRSCWQHSGIHNHRWYFESTVIVGTQVNHAFSVMGESFDPKRKPTHLSYLHNEARQAGGGRPWTPFQKVVVDPIGTQIVRAGEKYSVAQYSFHSTEPGGDGRVATIIKKWPAGDDAAQSLCRIGVVPDTDFDRFKWAPDDLWAVVREVLSGK